MASLSADKRWRILVTGASGYIGRHCVARLCADGHFVRGLSRGPVTAREPTLAVEWVRGDVRSRTDVDRAMAGIDCVLHLAGKAHDFYERDDDDQHAAVTTGGTQVVMESAASFGVGRVVFLSSLAVYAAGATSARNENDPTVPETRYGRAKLAAERIVLAEASRMHVACVRPAMVYGPGCKGQLPRMIAMVDRGWFPPPPRHANRRSLAYVDDVVDALLLAAARDEARGEVFIVTDTRVYSTREIYECICTTLGRAAPAWAVPLGGLRGLAKAGDVWRVVTGRRAPFDSETLEKFVGSAEFDSTKMRNVLGLNPTTSLNDVMPEIVAQYRLPHRPNT